MTASKSSRARNARIGAQASAARNAARGSGASGGARASGASRGGTATATKTAVARGGTAERGTRAPSVPDDAPPPGPAAWLQITTFVLALGGLGVSIYLTIAHFTDKALLGCSESGAINCTKVTTSPQSYVFGIPVAVLGLAFYVFAVAIMSPWAWRAARREIHLLRIVSLVVGMGFVLYLIYAELFLIGAICLYCTSVHSITFILFVLTAVAVAVWGLKPGAPWRPERPQPSE